MVEIGDCYKLQPTHSGSEERDAKRVPGVVIGIYSHGFALVDFGTTRECYPISKIEGAPKGRKR